VVFRLVHGPVVTERRILLDRLLKATRKAGVKGVRGQELRVSILDENVAEVFHFFVTRISAL